MVKTERSDATILGILGILAHFRHFSDYKIAVDFSSRL